MNYTEDKSQAGEYLRLALGRMAKHNLPATPVNYTVWYEYVSGRNLRLKNAVDRSLQREMGINCEFIEALYRKFVTDGDRIVISRLLTQINILLQDITRHVGQTDDDLSGTGKRMDELARMIRDVRDFEDLKVVVDRMVAETRTLKASSSRLKDQMQVSSKELNQLYQELEKSQQEAQTDALTGLVNRRGLERALEVEMIRARQNQTPLSVILLDIDHFKKVNDTYGHLVGDSLLKGLGAILKQQIRRKDLAVRYGGEEFLILLPETELEGALIVANKIRNALGSKEWKIRESGKTMGRVTASMGVSAHDPGDTPESFIQRADQGGYLGKELGRNRVVSQEELRN